MSKTSRTQIPRQTFFLQRLTEAQDRLLNAIADLDEATLTTECVVGDWTVKDILGHIVSWNDEFRANIKAILQGKHPGYEHRISGENDFDEWNQHWASQKHNWTWRRIRADLDRDYREASQLILRLQPEGFRKRGVTPWKRAAVEKPAVPTPADTESVATLVTYHWRHINMHARILEKWRKRRANRRE
jgi:hypothetical protein